jgi:hypothetical protein
VARSAAPVGRCGSVRQPCTLPAAAVGSEAFARGHPAANPVRGCHAERVDVPETIICVDCGGVAHLISYPPPDDPWEPGDIVAYRCADCLDRWDLVLADPEDD